MTVESIVISDSALHFDYTVSNYSSLRVYLLNNLFHQAGPSGDQVDRNLTYAYLEPGPILSLCKQMVAIPEGLDCETPEIPYLSLLEPHWTMTESLRLPLPIEGRHPYLTHPALVEVPLIPQFTFTLGYVFEDEPLELRETTLSDDSCQLQPLYGEIIGRQRLKRSATIFGDVPVLFNEPD